MRSKIGDPEARLLEPLGNLVFKVEATGLCIPGCIALLEFIKK
jgi:hypothetical protein